MKTSCFLAQLLLCASFIYEVVNASTSFTNPIGADRVTTYSLGQPITISWQGAENFTALSLGLRESSTRTIYWIIGDPTDTEHPSGHTANSYLWSFTLGNGESLSKGNVFSFWLVDGGYDTQIYSPEFYLVDPNASKTSSSSTTSTGSAPTSSISQPSSTTVTSSSASSAPASQTSAPSGAATDDSSSGLSTGAKAGVGVGVGVACCLGIGLAYFLFRRRERSRAARAPQMYDPTNEGKTSQPMNPGQDGHYGKGELPGDQPYGQQPYGIHQTHEAP